MAVFTETIELNASGVSSEAKAAQKAMADLTRGLEGAQAELVKTQALGDQDSYAGSLASVGKYTAAIMRLKAAQGDLLSEGQFSPIPEKEAPKATLPPSLLGDTTAISKATEALTANLKATEAEMVKLQALGDAEGFQAASAKADEYRTALGKLPPLVQAVEEETKKLVAPPLEVPNTKEGWKALTETIKGLTDELKGYEAEMLKAQVAGDGEGFAAAKEKADGLRAQLVKLPPVANKVEEGQKSMWESAADAAIVGKEIIGGAIDGIKSAFASLAAGDVKGAIAGVTDAVAGMAKTLDLVAPGLGQVVSAVISIAGGLAGVTAGLAISAAKFAIAANEAQKATDGMFDALGQGEITGDEVGNMVDGLRAKLGVAASAMEPFVQKFMAIGITGKAQLESLTTAAISMEAMVKGGGAAFSDLYTKVSAVADTGEKLKMPFKKMQASLAAAGLNVKDLAKEMGITAEELTKGLESGTIDAQKFGDAMVNAATTKGAGSLKNLANSAANLGALLNEYLGELFEDLGDSIAPFMDEVKKLFGIFDSKTNPSGEAMKAGIGGALKEIFGWATKVVPMVKHFLLDMIIYGLKAYIALKPIAKTLKEFFTVGAGAGILSAVLDGLKTAFIAVGGTIALIVGIAVGFVALMVTMNALVGAAIGYLMNLGTTIVTFVVGGFVAMAEWFAKAPQLALDFITGLVQGITNGGAAVLKSVTDLAGGAVNAFKSTLGIASPSKVMFEGGVNMGEGTVAGLEAMEGDVHGAASTMASQAAAGALAAPTPTAPPAVAGPAAAGDSGGAGGGSAAAGGNVFTFEPGAIQISGQGKDWSEITEEMVAAVMERIGMQIGVA